MISIDEFYWFLIRSENGCFWKPYSTAIGIQIRFFFAGNMSHALDTSLQSMKMERPRIEKIIKGDNVQFLHPCGNYKIGLRVKTSKNCGFYVVIWPNQTVGRNNVYKAHQNHLNIFAFGCQLKVTHE